MGASIGGIGDGPEGWAGKEGGASVDGRAGTQADDNPSFGTQEEPLHPIHFGISYLLQRTQQRRKACTIRKAEESAKMSVGDCSLERELETFPILGQRERARGNVALREKVPFSFEWDVTLQCFTFLLQIFSIKKFHDKARRP